jgi:transposase-like protein
MKTIQLTSPDSNQVQVSAMGATEGARRATGVAPMAGGRDSFVSSPPDPEVPEKKPRRKFTAKYKLRILAEADTCTQLGQLGALLRREGLYSSYLTTWRRQRENGILQVMAPKKRGRKQKEKNPLAKKMAQLEKENQRLQQKLKKAELIIEAQKKMSEILGIAQNLDENNESK